MTFQTNLKFDHHTTYMFDPLNLDKIDLQDFSSKFYFCLRKTFLTFFFALMFSLHCGKVSELPDEVQRIYKI
jgi:hypothetical protein